MLNIRLILLLILTLMSRSLFAQSAVDYEKALVSYNQQNYDEAYIHLKNALQDTPSHLQSKLMMGDILLRRKFPHSAIVEYEESLLLGADKNIAYLPLARAYIWINDYNKVIKLNTSELNENNTFEVTLLQAIAYENLNNIAKAKDKHIEAYQLSPQKVTAINGLARYYLRQGDDQKAQESVTKALSLQPQDAQSLHIQGQIYERQDDIKNALKYFKMSYQQAPAEAFITRSLANAHVKLKQFDEARELVNKILAISPDEPFIMLLSARLYSMDNNNELAVKAYEEINDKLALIPNERLLRQIELLFLSGLASYMTENYEVARNKLINYVNQNPDNLYALELLIDTHTRLDETKIALKLMETHYDVVKESLSLSMTLCDLYLKTHKILKCQILVSELRPTYPKANRLLDLMEVKTLQARGKYVEALAFFNQHFSDTKGLEIKKTAAILYLQNGQAQKALNTVDELIDLEPANIAHMLLKIETLIVLQRYDEALNVNNKVLEAKLNILAPKYNQANLHFLKADNESALSYAEILLPTYSKVFRVQVLLGNIKMALGQFEDAKNHFRTAKFFERDNTIPYEKTISIHRQLNDLPAALAELDKLQRTHILEAKYIQIRAEIYLKQNELELAGEQFRQLYSLWRDDKQQLLYLGQQQRIARLYIDSETTLLRALQVSPNYLFAKIELMRLYIKMNNIVKAETIIATLSQKTIDHSNIQMVLGDISLAKSQYEKAKRHYYRAIELNNNYQIAIIKAYRLATIQKVGQEKFSSTLNVILTAFPDSHFHRHILADFLYAQGDIEDATQHYLTLEKIETLPRLEFVYNNLANISLAEDPQAAIRYIDKALDIEQSNATFIDTKGWILTQQGKYVAGLDLLREAISMSADNPSIYYHIAYNLAKTGQTTAAKKALQKAFSANSNFPEKALADALFNSI
ncbi:XrtA/PEP-CTERM system TPR-repeat protein PrsT [uncultured Paraglaciecola sp.]|uniref:XrtA/PEP-CTERM system TPR-repeat protein PrsT n=1 Tax=uncultured Paraglaciecola sp. TaxID=1765024 RepID=UPI0025E5E017|nr:XrtA/PEP-CTERM system TPR-repeat protein PrsT [uncultured Paraglaciecola sp.]